MSETSTSPVIKAVELEWHGDVPLSTKHEDYYFSLKNGLDESRYVYLEQNQLPHRWLESPNKQPFTIIETGFGIGLNFLTTWQAWQKLPDKKQSVSFISIEKYPLTKTDLIRSLENWPELAELSHELITQYPCLMAGAHLLSFNQGRVKLLLIFGDVNRDLQHYSFMADCWFLDGFSPAKNPSMWTDSLFSLMAQRAHAETTFSSFTAAGLVRKGLSDAGFVVHKPVGFGGKRNMISGHFQALTDRKDANAIEQGLPLATPGWSIPDTPHTKFSRSNSSNSHTSNTEIYDVLIIGAGLAGLTTAAALAEKGLNVAIIEQKRKAVDGASGQSQLALYVKLPVIMNTESDFIAHSLHFSQRYLTRIQNQYPTKKFWHQSGLLQIAWNDKEANRHEKFIRNCAYPSDFIKQVNAAEASKLSNVAIQNNALWFEHSGWFDPHAFSRLILDNPNISLISNTQTNHIHWCNKSNTWEAISKNRSFRAFNLVIANSNDAKRLTQFAHLPTKPLRGQVTSIHNPTLPSSNTVLCGEGYLCPAINDWHHLGATFDLNRCDEHTYDSDNKKNIESLQKWLPDWLPDEVADVNKLTASGKIKARAGLRCTSPDYMPIVGRAPDYHQMLERFSPLRRDARSCSKLKGVYHPNLYLNIAYGSKGLVTAPIAAELLSSLITGSPSPFSSTQRAIIEPARFIIKRLKQGKI